MRPNNLIPVKVDERSFYKAWVDILTPFHKLTARERDVMARIIAQYFRLKESIEDPVVLREVLWSQSSRKDMRESLGVSQAYFQLVLKKMKDSDVIVNGDINPVYLPHKTEDPRLLLCVYYDWSSSVKPVDKTADGQK